MVSLQKTVQANLSFNMLPRSYLGKIWNSRYSASKSPCDLPDTGFLWLYQDFRDTKMSWPVENHFANLFKIDFLLRTHEQWSYRTGLSEVFIPRPIYTSKTRICATLLTITNLCRANRISVTQSPIPRNLDECCSGFYSEYKSYKSRLSYATPLISGENLKLDLGHHKIFHDLPDTGFCRLSFELSFSN